MLGTTLWNPDASRSAVRSYRPQTNPHLAGAPNIQTSGQTLSPPNFQQNALLPARSPMLNSTLAPQGLYSPQHTSLAANQSMALGAQGAASAGRPTGLQGISAASPGLLSRRATQAGQAMAGGMQGAVQARQSDAAANAQQMLGWQQARGQDWMGQLQNALQATQANQQYQQGSAQGLMQAMQGMGNLTARNAQNQLADTSAAANYGLQGQIAQGQDWSQQLQNAYQADRANQQYQQGSAQGLMQAMQGMGNLTARNAQNQLADTSAAANYGLQGQIAQGNDWQQQLQNMGLYDTMNTNFGNQLRGPLLNAILNMGYF